MERSAKVSETARRQRGGLPALVGLGAASTCLSLAGVLLGNDILALSGLGAAFAVIVGLAARERAGDRLLGAARTREARHVSLYRNAFDIISLVGPDNEIVYVSPSVKRVLGFNPERLVGRDPSVLVHPRDRIKVLRAVGESRSQPGSIRTVECRLAHRDGGWRHVETSVANLLGDPHVRAIVLNSRDITERRALEAELRHEARHDSLTGLANRTLFRESAQALDEAGTPDAAGLPDAAGTPGARDQRAVLFVDLDNFKDVNDILGHEAGDELLAAVARRLVGAVGRSALTARLGGDEFAVLLTGDQAGTPTETADRILQAFATPFLVRGRPTIVHLSIGIAGEDGQTGAGELLRNADLALYAAKSAGRDRRVTYQPEMYQAVARRVELETGLRLAAEHMDFALHYQPIVSLETGEIVALEALLRWPGPSGLVAQDVFISLAERTGLIVPIGRWALREACRQARAWQDHHPNDVPMGISVNISAVQAIRPDLVNEVAATLRETGLEPRHLTLEFTESILMQGAAALTGNLARLRALGVRLALDDFGSGKSSLEYLRWFRADLLKVDRSFTDRIVEPGETALAKGVVELAHTLGLKTVAEGVERQEQLDALRHLAFDQAQGFLFAPPLPAGPAGELVARRYLLGESLFPPVIPPNPQEY